MDYSVEGYLRRQSMETLKVICSLPEDDIIEDFRELAKIILEEKRQNLNSP